MTTIKISEARGAVLDYLVAKCEGRHWIEPSHNPHNPLMFKMAIHGWRPSTEWAQGGPIIEREKMDVDYAPDQEQWGAYMDALPAGYANFGPTALIAAMRCYVTSKLGEEVDVPEELLP